MNLVAKEFVAAREDEDGVLVLSALAGAAEELREALIINPYDVDGFARAVIRALDMTLAERTPPDARDASRGRRPQRLQLGIGHPRGAREPVDQTAPVRGEGRRRRAGLVSRTRVRRMNRGAPRPAGQARRAGVLDIRER